MVAGSKFNFGVLTRFNEEYYKNLIDYTNFKEEIVIGEKEEEQRPFWLVYKQKQKFLFDHIPLDKIKFPFKVVSTEPVYYKGKYFHHIKGVVSLVFKKEKSYNFREIIDKIFNFVHSCPDDYLMYKICVLGTYLDRINTRLVSEAGFGKDGIYKVLEALCKDINVTNPKSTAAIEYRLGNKVLVLADLSNLDKAQIALMQDFLLLCGDMSSIYHKSTRGSSQLGTKDTYDISQLSLVISHNIKSYYDETGQKYFGDIFTRAVKSRFLPLFFDGTIDLKQFKFDEPILDVMLAHKEEYVRLIRTLKWYKENFKSELKPFKLDKEYTFQHERQWQNFDRLCQFINLYCNTEEEYKTMVEKLYTCYTRAVFLEQKEGQGLVSYKDVVEVKEERVSGNDWWEKLDENKDYAIPELKVSQQEVNKQKTMGNIFEPRLGFVRRL